MNAPLTDRAFADRLLLEIAAHKARHSSQSAAAIWDELEAGRAVADAMLRHADERAAGMGER